MSLNRRNFVKTVGLVGISSSVTGETRAGLAEIGDSGASRMGVLVDIPNCIGCRKCEYACREAAGFPVPPMETFDDKTVFAKFRRPTPGSYTTVNQFENPVEPAKPVYVKTNCFHCNDPACVSACLVGAFQKAENGAVIYDAWKCIGCRYCMVACPFQIPTYDYENALTPQVRKCTFCFDRLSQNGGVPACVKICPNDALTFGTRIELLDIAHERVRAHPERYIDHVYGEKEAGGTSWLYLSNVSFEKLGFLALAPEAPSRLTEKIQHGVFKHWIPPLALYGLLGLIHWISGQDQVAPRNEVSS